LVDSRKPWGKEKRKRKKEKDKPKKRHQPLGKRKKYQISPENIASRRKKRKPDTQPPKLMSNFCPVAIYLYAILPTVKNYTLIR